MNISFLNRIALCFISYALVAVAPAAHIEVVPVVSSKSPVSTLSATQLVDIFLGKENRFPNGDPVIPLDLTEGSGIRDEFYLRFAERSPAQLKAYWSKLIFTGKAQPPRELSSSEKVRKAVAKNPHYIGYVPRSEVDSSLKVVEVKGK